MAENDPFELFDQWFATARAAESADPTAMALATTTADGHPSVRMVLLKKADARGFVFYTNLESPKARDLRENPRAALCIHWAKLERQVRIEGTVEPVSEAEADAYFASRPRLSQLGAWASRQSSPMKDRFALEPAVAAAALRFHIGAVPRPPHWSGYRVVPEKMEFWQQRPFRHHDRQLYTRGAGGWTMQWLFRNKKFDTSAAVWQGIPQIPGIFRLIFGGRCSISANRLRRSGALPIQPVTSGTPD